MSSTLTKLTADQVAAYFVNQNEQVFPNSFDGNMKLQKLIVFANLIHLVKNNELLFEESMYAFRNGIVVETVRKPYYQNYQGYIETLKKEPTSYSKSEVESLQMSMDLFNSLSARELSDLHHELETWKHKYNKSKFGNFHITEISKIKEKDILETDIEKIKKIINAYKRNENQKYLSETVNGITFYYDPDEMDFTVDREDLLSVLEDLSKEISPGEENVFFITYDESQGFYYY